MLGQMLDKAVLTNHQVRQKLINPNSKQILNYRVAQLQQMNNLSYKILHNPNNSCNFICISKFLKF